MLEHFQPFPGDYGSEFILVQTPPIGGAAGPVVGGASPLTANTTTIIPAVIPGGPRGRTLVLVGLCARVTQVPADADGTLKVTARKYRASDNTVVTVSAELDLEALVTRETGWVGLASGISDANRTFNVPAAGAGDGLEFHVVSDSAAIDTQPTLLVLGALFKVLK